jgi:hypothetical protein
MDIDMALKHGYRLGHGNIDKDPGLDMDIEIEMYTDIDIEMDMGTDMYMDMD